MAYENYAGLRVERAGGIARITIDHAPINLLDVPLIVELDRLGRELEADEQIRVSLFESADAEFFIAHADVGAIQAMEAGPPPEADSLSFFHAMLERFRTLPHATIAKLEGIARGGGSEFLLSLDMRFGALETARLSQPEVALGILPGGGGTQRLPRLVGRARALEIILGCGDFDAELAERYGWLNRALPAAELGAFVDGLARRIASFPREAIVLAKQAALAAEPDWTPGLIGEAQRFDRALRSAPARERMARFMALGGQTRETERAKLEDLYAPLTD